MAHPFFDVDTFPFKRQDAQEFLEHLTSCYPKDPEIELVYQTCGGKPGTINMDQAANLIWMAVLEDLTRRDALEGFCNYLVADSRYPAVKIAAQHVIEAKQVDAAPSRTTAAPKPAMAAPKLAIAVIAGVLVLAIIFAVTRFAAPRATPQAAPPSSAAVTQTSAPTTTPPASATLPPPTTPTVLPAVLLPTATPTCAYETEGEFRGLATELKLGCATGEADVRSIAWQQFVKGHAFWRAGAPNNLYVFEKDSKNVQTHPNGFADGVGQPEIPNCATDLQLRYVIKRGFGYMWCDIPSAQNALGEPVGLEDGQDQLVQEFDYGWISKVRMPLNAIIGCSNVTRKWAMR